MVITMDCLSIIEGSNPSWLVGSIKSQIVHLLYTMFNFTVSRSSAAIEAIHCQLMSGFVLVSYKNGSTYAYKNVSKRAILNLYFNKNISLGFWANSNLIDNERVSFTNVEGLVKFYSPERFFASA